MPIAAIMFAAVPLQAQTTTPATTIPPVSAANVDKSKVKKPAEMIAGSMSEDDYPVEARRLNQQGRVVITYVIDEHGNVTNCSVAKSSGSALLDNRTCEIFVSRMKFRPALDASGKPVKSLRAQGVNWALDSGTPPMSLDGGPVTHTTKITLVRSPRGEYVSCTSTVDGKPAELNDDPCDAYPRGTPLGPPTTYRGKPVSSRETIKTVSTTEPVVGDGQ